MNRRRSTLAAVLTIVLLACVWSVVSTGAPVRAQEDAPTLVIRGGTIFDGARTGVRELGQLWIRGGKVVGEREAGTKIPVDVKVLDATGMTVMPGLFDLHVHLQSTGSFYNAPVRIAPERNYAAFLAAGVTSVLDLFSDPDWVFAQRDASKELEFFGPRIYAAGPILTAPGGHGTQMGVDTSTMSTREEAVAAVRELAERKPDVVKIAYDDLAFSGYAMNKLEPGVAAAAVDEAHRLGLRVFTHVTNVDDAIAMVNAGTDAFAHFPAFPGKSATDEELAELMVARGVGVVPTINLFENVTIVPERGPVYEAENFEKKVAWEVVEVVTDSAMRQRQAMMGWRGATPDGREGWRARLMAMHRAGVRIGAGTDAGNPQAFAGVSLVDELAWYVAAGMSTADALRSATSDAAKLLGVEKNVGTLEAGMRADVLIVEGDPLADIANLHRTRHVIRAGRLLDLEEVRRAVNPADSLPSVRKPGTPVVDDFDDGDMTAPNGLAWAAETDAYLGGASEVELTITEESALRVSAKLGGNPRYGAYLGGVGLRLTQAAKDRADLSDYTGVRFRARWVSGNTRPVILRLATASVRDFDYHQKFLQLEPEWKEMQVAFSSLAQIGFGLPQKFAKAEAQQIVFTFYGAPPGSFAFELDDIEFY